MTERDEPSETAPSPAAELRRQPAAEPLETRSVDSLKLTILRLLRRFGLVSALWTTLLAVAAGLSDNPEPAPERPVVLAIGVAVVWVWAIASQFVSSPRSWFIGWLAVGVPLEVLPAFVGTSEVSLTGGAALIILFAAAMSSRRRVVWVSVGLLSAATVARPVIDSDWSADAPVGSVLVFVFVAWVCMWVVRWTERSLDERDRLQERVTAAERERAVAVSRAEAAARLHDSVLQTLTAATRADRLETSRELARKASTELRLWVRGRAGEETSLRELLERRAREAADGGELSVNVTGGVSEPTDVDVLVADAMAEAVRNARLHAEGPISVYAEAGDDSLSIWVADRGTGFELDEIPADRAGVRESILGRMQRAGGTATLRRTSTGGSEWELRVP